MSSTEAQYVAMGDGLKVTIFLRRLWSFIFPAVRLGRDDGVRGQHGGHSPGQQPFT